jgi:hypothetical protein
VERVCGCTVVNKLCESSLLLEKAENVQSGSSNIQLFY